MCSPSPATVGTSKAMEEKDKLANEEEAKSAVSVDKNAPTTTVQIRLADGSRLVATLNNTHTIADLRRYITLYPLNYILIVFSLLKFVCLSCTRSIKVLNCY